MNEDMSHTVPSSHFLRTTATMRSPSLPNVVGISLPRMGTHSALSSPIQRPKMHCPSK